MQHTYLRSCRAARESKRLAAQRLERIDQVLWAAYDRSDRVAVFRALLARLTTIRNSTAS